MEKWRDVVGYEGRYRVSSLGRVRSLGNSKRPKGKMLKLVVRKDGYRTVTLYDGSSGRTSGKKVKVCHLVLLAFVGEKPLGKTDACHRDTDSLNDTLGNLYWGTRRENMLDTVRTGRIVGENNHACKLTDDDVATVRRLGATCSGKSLAERFGVSEGLISGILSGDKRRHT